MLVPKPCVLFVDAYDSFSNNIISLLETELSADVRVVKIDSPLLQSDADLLDELSYYDAVVCGPGPGTPLDEKDVGLMKRIWQLDDEHLLPVLGICLGFQSLAETFGGRIKRLEEPQHGIIHQVNHIGPVDLGRGNGLRTKSMFRNVGTVMATCYHSLHVDIGQDDWTEEEWNTGGKWRLDDDAKNLSPLAWIEKNDQEATDSRILAAVQHRRKPFAALQYHPESICTNAESKKVIRNWFRDAIDWNKSARQTPIRQGYSKRAEKPVRSSLLSQSVVEGSKTEISDHELSAHIWGRKDWRYESVTLDLPEGLSVSEISDYFCFMQKEIKERIVLESTNADQEGAGVDAVRGRYSIIGLDIDEAERLEYCAGEKHYRFWSSSSSPSSSSSSSSSSFSPSAAGASSSSSSSQGFSSCSSSSSSRGFSSSSSSRTLPSPGYSPVNSTSGIWSVLAAILELRRVKDGLAESPFWGGFMGYTTYEMGLQGIDVSPRPEPTRHRRPDMCFAFVTKSIVIDHKDKKIHIQQLVDNSTTRSNEWLAKMSKSFESMADEQAHRGRITTAGDPAYRISCCHVYCHVKNESNTNVPSNEEYESKVSQCQSYIAAGESYELCLTAQSLVTVPHVIPRISDPVYMCERDELPEPFEYPATLPPPHELDMVPWHLYCCLREDQPAPFASFIRLGSATLISGSPERFLKWDADGKCELRPMKGTVKKSAEVDTLQKAEAKLGIAKERAENLMIVDLVRHDLHGICGAGNVQVPRLMVVEEHASVYQMISVVEGQIPVAAEGKEKERYTGIDVLAASLPPGSMTGAPKKRSCEILQEIEGQGTERSLYSGVVGYMDVGGRGDFSVTIRSLFRWDNETIREGEGELSERLEIVKKGEEENRKFDVWHVGAGGAVTTLSTPVGEREEMRVKASGPLGLFESE